MNDVHISATHAWTKLLQTLTSHEIDSVAPRDQQTKEVLGVSTSFDMCYPVVTNATRNLGYKFLAAEAAWILSGDNRVETIAPYAKKIGDFSDDGIRFFGAYGPRIVDQISYIVDTLVRDCHSRQAVMTIWRPNPRATKDVPCTVSVQWLIRNGQLHCIDSMRSSDAWLGWPYDVFNFSLLSAMIAVEYRMRTGVYLAPGTFTLIAGSHHLYERNYERAKSIADIRSRVHTERGPQLKFATFEHSSEVVSRLWQYASTGDLATQEAI